MLDALALYYAQSIMPNLLAGAWWCGAEAVQKIVCSKE
jgi:hypothetical protein